MSDLSTTIVEGYHYTGDDLDLSGTDFWGFALDQRAFGPRQLVVVTARADGAVLGLAHCERTERPELALRCCLVGRLRTRRRKLAANLRVGTRSFGR